MRRLMSVVLVMYLVAGAPVWAQGGDPDEVPRIGPDTVDAVIEVFELQASEEAVEAVVWSHDGALFVTSSQDGLLRVWDADEFGLLSQTEVVRSPEHLAFSPDDVFLGSSTTWSGDVTLWSVSRTRDWAGVEQHATLSGHGGAIAEFAFNIDGTQIATASLDNTARLWDVASGETLTVYLHDDAVTDVAFSHDGALLATAGDDGTVRVHDLDSGEERVLVDQSGGFDDVAFTADDDYLVYASAEGAGVVSLRRGTVLHDFETALGYTVLGNHSDLWISAPGPDPLATEAANANLALVFYNARTGVLLGEMPITLRPHELALRPDDAMLAMALGDGTVHLYGLAGRHRFGGEATCDLTVQFAVAGRVGPGAVHEIADQFTAGDAVTAIGQSPGPGGMRWFQLEDLTWLREDVVQGGSACADLPRVPYY